MGGVKSDIRRFFYLFEKIFCDFCGVILQRNAYICNRIFNTNYIFNLYLLT